MYKPESREAKFGEWAQLKADEILIREGWGIIGVHKSGEGKAALIQGRDPIIAMDNIDLMNGRAIFRDTKGKTQSTFWIIGQKEQHGIDAKLFMEYNRQCKLSGMDGYIAIVELNREIEPRKLIPSNKLLIYSIEMNIRFFSREKMRNPYGKGGMVYWNRDEYLEEFDLEEK